MRRRAAGPAGHRATSWASVRRAWRRSITRRAATGKPIRTPLRVTLEIRAVGTRRDLRRFVAFPYSLYAKARYPNWVPPLRAAVYDALDTRKNPFYREADRALFLALRDGRMVGRIAAIENRAHNRFSGDRTGFWGFFECEDDRQAADWLFAAVRGWLSARGLTSMVGPMNPSTNYE